MKKVFALVMVLAMVFAFTACGSQMEDVDNENTGVTEISVGEGLPTFTFENPKYEQELSDTAAEEMTHYYTMDEAGEVPACGIFEFDKNDMTLEEFTVETATEYRACWEVSQFEGVDCGFLVSSYESDDEWLYDRTWIFEKEDKFVAFSFYSVTKEIAIGDSNYSVYIPTLYEESDADTENEYLLAAYDYTHLNTNMIPYAHFEIVNADWLYKDYEAQKALAESVNVVLPFTKEKYESWQADGWTLDEIKAFFDAQFKITDQVDFTKEEYGFDGWVFEENHDDENGVPQTTVRVIIADGDKYYEIKFDSAKEDWSQQGHAFACAIHANK